MSARLDRSEDKYPECNFCSSKDNVYKIDSTKQNLRLAVSICDKCMRNIMEDLIKLNAKESVNRLKLLECLNYNIVQDSY